jgi:hypothetical protein
MAKNVLDRFELSTFEKIWSNLCLSGDYITMATSFIESKDSQTCLTESLLMEALVCMQRRHPFLRAHLEIQGLDHETMFFALMDEHEARDKIELKFVDLTPYSREKLLDESAHFNSLLFDFNQRHLLWRSELISYQQDDKIKYVLNLAFFVTLTDGLNSTALSIEIANILNALLSGQTCHEMVHQLEPAESLFAYCSKSNIFKLDAHLHLVEKLEKEQKRVQLLFPSSFKGSDEGFKLEFFKLKKETTAKIIELSKCHKIRLTAFFYTALYYALAKLYRENDLPTLDQVTLELPASLRVRYKPMLEVAHARHHIVTIAFSTKRERFGEYSDFWKDCRYIDDEVKKACCIENKSLFSFSFANLHELNERLRKAKSSEERSHVALNSFSSDLILSNLGNTVSNQTRLFPGPMQIEELYCSDSLQTNPRLSSAILAHLLFWNGQIMVQFGANRAVIADVYLQRLIHFYKETIHESLAANKAFH